MTATVTFFPLGNADTTRIDLNDGRKILVDFADVRDKNDDDDKRCDLPTELRGDLKKTKRDYIDVVCFSHLDEDHVKGSGDFFHFDQASKYQGEGRIKIKELWVPAGALTESNVEGDARVIRQEARYRLKEGKGIKVFSRPDALKSLLDSWELTIEERKNCIADAGTFVPGFSWDGEESVQFFVHSPFAWKHDDRGYEERNADSIMFQASFKETDIFCAIFGADVASGDLSEIVKITKSHKNDDRLLWDLLKLFHHCSYLSLSDDKGEDETKPIDEVAWLFETQGRAGCKIISPSKPIPKKGSDEDKDVQPPHRQAANYYRRILGEKDGEFKVTMETPNETTPKPISVEITSRGVRLLSPVIAAAAVLTSAPARAGLRRRVRFI